MNTFFRSIKSVKLSYILNLAGLAAAFATLLVIMIQVRYDYGFDKFYSESDKIFRIEFKSENDPSSPYLSRISRPLGEALIGSTPGIAAGGIVNEEGISEIWIQGEEKTTSLSQKISKISEDIVKIFEFKILSGDTSAFRNPNSAIISQSDAKILFTDRDPIGQVLEIKSYKYPVTVVAVYKDFPDNSNFSGELFVNIGDEYLTNQSEWSFTYFVKLYDSGEREKVTNEMKEYFKTTLYPQESDSISEDFMRLSNIHDIYFSKDVRYDTAKKGNINITHTLLSIAILIIIIAVINFINFAMAMVPLKIRGLNTRKILGSGIFRLRANLILESVIISLIGYGFALLIVQYFSGTTYSSLISADTALAANRANLSICAVIAILTGVMAGVYPAIYSTSFSPAVAIKGSFGLTPKGRRIRTILIAFQYIISVVLIIFALFINVQSRFMKRYDMGYNKENILNTRVTNTIARQKSAFVAKLKENPVIKDVTFADGPLLSNSKMGWGRMYKGVLVKYDCYPVDPNFISFFNITILEGRDFIEEDNLKSNGTIIFNEAAMNAYPFVVGEGMGGHTDEPADIVGVVKNFNFQPLQYAINPIALYIFGTNTWRLQTFMFVKISGEYVKEAFNHIEKSMREFDPTIKDVNITFMDESIGKLYAKEDNLAKLILISSIISVFISIIGVLGLIFFETQFRQKEIGIRKVAGAEVFEIIKMFNISYIKLTFICFAAGSPIAHIILLKWLNSFEYKAPIPVWIYVASLTIVLTITVAAISLQSFRAATANPVKSLKSE
jgi:putative ABC transport system permease protein